MAAGPVPCGTLRGYRRHIRRSETSCDACRQAKRAYDRARDVHLRTPEPCGTDGGYQRHLRGGEQTCRACRDAHAEQGRAGRARGAARDLFNAMLAEAWAETAS